MAEPRYNHGPWSNHGAWSNHGSTAVGRSRHGWMWLDHGWSMVTPWLDRGWTMAIGHGSDPEARKSGRPEVWKPEART
eukprot:gene2657-2075_t